MSRTGWILCGAATAAAVSLAMWLLLGHRHTGEEEELHAWMHANLNLTEAQNAALDPLEKAFAERRSKLRQAIDEAAARLGSALLKGELHSPEAEGALDQMDRAQADLRRATLEHFFAMKGQLDPEQSAKLLEWVAASISPDGHRR